MRTDSDGVADLLPLVELFPWPASFDEEVQIALRVQARRGDSFLQRKAAADVAKQHFEHGVGDLSAARSAQRCHRGAVAQNDGRAHIVQRPFAWANRIGMPGPRLKTRHTMSQNQPQTRHRYTRPEMAAVCQ